jgi:SAM-dependent methyltransferase
MPIPPDLRQRVMQQTQGVLALSVAFVGAANGLFAVLAQQGPATPAALASSTGLDAGYLERWCDAAFACGYLDEQPGGFTLTDLGEAFRPDQPDSLWPAAMSPVMGGHMADHAATGMRTGDRPGEGVLVERRILAGLFGPMLEARYGALFRRDILPALTLYERVDATGGLVVDLGCGNGWYLRALAERYPRLRGRGLDGLAENIDDANARARTQGWGDRLSFHQGDLHRLALDRPVAAFAMNRALHHVWEGRASLLEAMAEQLEPGGAVVIWEPRWPDDRADLRTPPGRALAWQNLAEHVQGNRFLRPAEIEGSMRAAGLQPETRLFADGYEAVVIGTKPA